MFVHVCENMWHQSVIVTTICIINLPIILILTEVKQYHQKPNPIPLLELFNEQFSFT